MKIEIKCLVLVLVVLNSVSVKAITHFVKSESSKTMEKEKTVIQWSEDERENDVFKGQREIATVSPTTSSVELVDAKETVTDKTQNPIVVAYFVTNLGEKSKDSVLQEPRTTGSGDGFGSYGLQALGFDSHLSQNKPYTGYRLAPVSEYGYGYGGYGYGYGYSPFSGYGHSVLGKFGRKLRRIRDHLHFWRGFTKRLL